jgi:hypothetical protein
MTRTLASNIARSSFDTFLESARGQDRLSTDEAREFVVSCEIPIAVLDKRWQLIQGLLDRGIEGKRSPFC